MRRMLRMRSGSRYPVREVSMKLDYFKKRFLSLLVRNSLLAMLLWTGGVAGSLWWSKLTLQKQNIALAMTTARSTVNKDLAFRAWAGAHGGVYVEADDNTPPNPYLSEIPDRDLVTSTGKRLTLINPAYMLRLVMAENAHLFGSKGHLTSLQLTNPVNQPDAWEKAALESFQQNAQEATTVADIDGKPHLRAAQQAGVRRAGARAAGNSGAVRGTHDGRRARAPLAGSGLARQPRSIAGSRQDQIGDARPRFAQVFHRGDRKPGRPGRPDGANGQAATEPADPALAGPWAGLRMAG